MFTKTDDAYIENPFLRIKTGACCWRLLRRVKKNCKRLEAKVDRIHPEDDADTDRARNALGRTIRRCDQMALALHEGRLEDALTLLDIIDIEYNSELIPAVRQLGL